MAYASVGNVAVGFDMLGHSVAGAGDRAVVRRIDEPTVRIAAIHGCVTDLPLDASRNTAGAALLSLRKALGLRHGFELELHKGIALGSGMGGSAASCVAALVAANALLERPLPRESLYGFALDGEAVASGSRHGDNLGPMLLGGLVLATRDRLLRLPVPDAWHCALVHPHVVLETRESRAVAGRGIRPARLRGATAQPRAGARRLSSRRRRPGARRPQGRAGGTTPRAAGAGISHG